MTTREKIIKIAEWQIGVKESPPNSNDNPYGLWANLNLLPWCAVFVSWAYDQAGVKLSFPLDPAKGFFPWGFSYVPTAYNYWKAQGKLTTDPQPGDIVMFDWQKGKQGETATEMMADHVGIFHSWISKKDGTFFTIEGNTAVSNDSNGGSVMRRQRNQAFVLGIASVL